MSNHDQDNNDEILARNVGELLRQGHEPPRIDSAASARIFAALEERLPKASDAEATGKQVSSDSKGGLLSSIFAGLFASPLRAGALAAVVAGAVVVGGVLLNRGGDRDVSVAAFVPRELVNDSVAPQRVELADGTVLILRAGASAVTTGPRSLELRGGDILFDVAKGDAPFVITRPGRDHRITVLGTRFVTSASEASLLTAVIRGSVRLEADGKELVLGAGEGGEATNEGPPARKPIPRLSHLVSWSKAARARAEGTDVAPIRSGNLVARFAGLEGTDYPLPVREFGVDIHLENQVARVAIDQTFFNEHPTDLEGLYSFSLPAGAAISRLAMYVNGELMEAGIAERDRARRVYESIVYRRRDPALMEWMAGNEVKVRIFPLFGRQEKRILLSYTQSLERLYDDVQLTVPLPRLEKPVGALKVRARLADCAECEVASTSHAIQTRVDGNDLLVELDAKKFQIEDDLLLSVRKPPSDQHVVVKRDGDDQLVLARVTPQLANGTMARTKPRRWVILHDTSGSRQPMERKAQVHVIDRLLDELDETDEVAVVAFDATVRSMNDGAFVAVANADRKATHDFADEQGSAGVGYTDLAKGLEAAVRVLAEAPNAADYEPMIIYLGDGVVTGGERRPGDLVRAVAGRATVVAVAIGATHDDAVLSALAGETGGMSAVLNPGQDLDWRVFDLVASLHGERITDLRAEVDGSEAPVYISTRQLAAGEEVALVARVGAELPASLRLRGSRGGKPWTMEVPLGPGMLTDGAGYLPRLWARARIASLLEAEGLEEGVDHRAEVTALAMKHWLLTPYTSLLVLENDAAYRKYKVARSSMTGWASYKVPETIKVVSEPLTAGIDLAAANIGALVFRSPLPLFNVQQAQQSYYRNSRRGWDRGWGNEFGESFGTIGAGLGTGRGFGVGGGGSRGSVWLPEGSVASKFAKEKGDAKAEPPREAQPDPEQDESGAFDDIVTGLEARDKTAFRGPRLRRQAGRQANDLLDANLATTPLQIGGEHAQPLIPNGMTWPSDRRFDDLTMLLPAMFSTELDRQRERLAQLDIKKTKLFDVEPAAARMIERARELAGRRIYRTDGGVSIAVDSRGRFQINRTTVAGSVERLDYDGESLVTRYPELDIAVRRTVAAAEPILLEAEVPMLLARSENLARFYAVTRLDDKAIALTPPKAKWRLVVRFDDKGRVIKLEREEGAVVTTLLSLSHDSGKVVVTRDETKLEFDVAAISDAALDGAAATSSVEISMPLRHPGYVEAQLAVEPTRANQHQLAASYAALGLFAKAGALAAEMASTSPLSDGELTLLSGGITMVARKDAAVALAGGDAKSVLRRYLRGAVSFRFNNNADAFGKVASEPGWVGLLALLRQTEAAIVGSGPSSTLLSRLIKRDTHQTFAFIGTFAFDQYQRWRAPKTVVAKWRELIETDRAWAGASQVRLAYALANAGKNEAAASLWESIRDKALDSGRLPLLDYQTASAFRGSPRGEAGWQAFWGTTRERVLDSGDTQLIIGLLAAARNLGHAVDIPRIATAASANGLTTAERLQVIGLVSSAGMTDVARRLFEPLEASVTAGDVSDPAVLRMASGFASARGQHLAAARLFRRALDLDDSEASLAQIRGEYARLIQLYASAAQLGAGSERDESIAAMLEASSEWRGLDPDNAGNDSQVATALFSVGESTEAMRILSTAIERRPMEGRSFEVVATALEGQGRAADAIALWERAMTVEPENPTWPLRLARALSAVGRGGEAKTVLDKVVSRKNWHERFVWIVEQAKQTRDQL